MLTPMLDLCIHTMHMPGPRPSTPAPPDDPGLCYLFCSGARRSHQSCYAHSHQSSVISHQSCYARRSHHDSAPPRTCLYVLVRACTCLYSCTCTHRECIVHAYVRPPNTCTVVGICICICTRMVVLVLAVVPSSECRHPEGHPEFRHPEPRVSSSRVSA